MVTTKPGNKTWWLLQRSPVLHLLPLLASCSMLQWHLQVIASCCCSAAVIETWYFGLRILPSAEVVSCLHESDKQSSQRISLFLDTCTDVNTVSFTPWLYTYCAYFCIFIPQFAVSAQSTSGLMTRSSHDSAPLQNAADLQNLSRPRELLPIFCRATAEELLHYPALSCSSVSNCTACTTPCSSQYASRSVLPCIDSAVKLWSSILEQWKMYSSS